MDGPFHRNKNPNNWDSQSFDCTDRLNRPLREEQNVNYELPAELWSAIVPLSLAIGAVGGLIWEIGNTVRRSQSDPELGLGNAIELPRWHKTSSGRTLFELGVLGSMAVGAVAGTLLVLLVAPGGPSSEEVAKAVVTANTAMTETPATGTANNMGSGQSSPAGQAAGGEPEPTEPTEPTEPEPTERQPTEAVEEELSTSVSGVQLISLALLGGLAGWGLIQSLTTKFTEVFGGLIGKTAQSAGEEAKKTIEQAVSKAQPAMSQSEIERIAEEGGEKVEEAAATAVVAEPPASTGKS
jgi:hypothetical protein